MPPVRRILRFVLPLLFIVPTCASGQTRDEFLCEEAHARLVTCCPGFAVPSGWCTYTEGCGTETFPALSERDSIAIRGASCARLREEGTCVNAAAHRKRVVDTDGPDSGSSW